MSNDEKLALYDNLRDWTYAAEVEDLCTNEQRWNALRALHALLWPTPSKEEQS